MGRLLYLQIYLVSLFVHSGRSLSATNKLSLASWGSYDRRGHEGPGTYSFGYDVEDPVTGNVQFRQEERHPNGTVSGSYGYVDADGVPRVTHYISDINGYRILENGPGTVQKAEEPTRVFAGDNFPVFFSNDRIHNPPTLMYQFHGSPPFLSYYNNYLAPIPYIYARK